jgi:hypothetical protein
VNRPETGGRYDGVDALDLVADAVAGVRISRALSEAWKVGHGDAKPRREVARHAHPVRFVGAETVEKHERLARSPDEVHDVMPGDLEPRAFEPGGAELGSLRQREGQARQEEIDADRQSEEENESDEEYPQSPHRPGLPVPRSSRPLLPVGPARAGSAKPLGKRAGTRPVRLASRAHFGR